MPARRVLVEATWLLRGFLMRFESSLPTARPVTQRNPAATGILVNAMS